LYFALFTCHDVIINYNFYSVVIFVCKVEVSTGQFPYRDWNSIFDQLMQVVQGEPPFLDVERDQFSKDFVDFVNTW